MTEPPTTAKLAELATTACYHAQRLRSHTDQLAALVAVTGVELSAAARCELATDLHDAVLALHTARLDVYEPDRGTSADR